jgi:hypothetical protein
MEAGARPKLAYLQNTTDSPGRLDELDQAGPAANWLRNWMIASAAFRGSL